MRTVNPYADYSHVTYWPCRGGISARWRGRWSDCETWFPTLAEFRRAARKQLRNKSATRTTEEAMTTYCMIYGN